MAGEVDLIKSEFQLGSVILRRLGSWVPVPFLASIPSAMLIANLIGWSGPGKPFLGWFIPMLPFSAVYLALALFVAVSTIRGFLQRQMLDTVQERDEMLDWVVAKIWLPSLTQLAILLIGHFWFWSSFVRTHDAFMLLGEVVVALLSAHLVFSPFTISGILSWIPSQNSERIDASKCNVEHLFDLRMKWDLRKEEAEMVRERPSGRGQGFANASTSGGESQASRPQPEEAFIRDE